MSGAEKMSNTMIMSVVERNALLVIAAKTVEATVIIL